MGIIELFVYNRVDKILNKLIKMLTKLDKYIDAQIAEEQAITTQMEALGERSAQVAKKKQTAENLKEKIGAIVN